MYHSILWFHLFNKFIYVQEEEMNKIFLTVFYSFEFETSVFLRFKQHVVKCF